MNQNKVQTSKVYLTEDNPIFDEEVVSPNNINLGDAWIVLQFNYDDGSSIAAVLSKEFVKGAEIEEQTMPGGLQIGNDIQ